MALCRCAILLAASRMRGDGGDLLLSTKADLGPTEPAGVLVMKTYTMQHPSVVCIAHSENPVGLFLKLAVRGLYGL